MPIAWEKAPDTALLTLIVLVAVPPAAITKSGEPMATPGADPFWMAPRKVVVVPLLVIVNVCCVVPPTRIAGSVRTLATSPAADRVWVALAALIAPAPVTLARPLKALPLPKAALV